MPRKKDVPDVPLDETPDPHYAKGPPAPHDVGVLLAKDRAGPVREKYPTSDGAANFSSMHQRALDAVAYAKAGEPKQEVA